MPNNQIVKMNDALFNKLGEVVSDDERTDFLPKNLKNNALAYINFENMVYSMAAQMSKDYKGGQWVFVQCKDNKGFFMYPSSGEFLVHSENFIGEHTVDNKTFGLIATIMVSSHGSFAFQGNKEVCELFGDNCQKLHSHFFNVVDKFCFGEEDENGEDVQKGTDFSSITPEQRKEMSELSSVVYNYLD